VFQYDRKPHLIQKISRSVVRSSIPFFELLSSLSRARATPRTNAASYVKPPRRTQFETRRCV